MPFSELEPLQEAIRSESLDGWLFCNFRHRDRISDEILGVPQDMSNTRLWIYAVPSRGSPWKILHAVEPAALEHLPGEKTFYRSRDGLLAALKPLAGKSWGVQSSEYIAAISFLDAGTAAVLEKAGLSLVSAGALIQRFRGILDSRGIDSHEKAAVHLYEIVDRAWKLVKNSRSGSLCEGDIRSMMLTEMENRGLDPGHTPIVAAGANAGNPHYDFSGLGAEFQKGDVIQFDLWAKEKKPGAIWADISWVGVYAETPGDEYEKAFADLLGARDKALAFIEKELAASKGLTGARVDRKTREALIGLGYEQALKHRTGHGIDTELHGSGVNMDSVEFPDDRLILEGSCFSLEPGIYFENFGMRTEIDVYIKAGKPVVSGYPWSVQRGLLLR
ncbi:MAG: M24 family metallopeptidase [Treponema sp.]|jgi:Xaa-Pro aminopeptidase|nr:M24 family metallopeptidase [Treponema sp.]